MGLWRRVAGGRGEGKVTCARQDDFDRLIDELTESCEHERKTRGSPTPQNDMFWILSVKGGKNKKGWGQSRTGKKKKGGKGKTGNTKDQAESS